MLFIKWKKVPIWPLGSIIMIIWRVEDSQDVSEQRMKTDKKSKRDKTRLINLSELNEIHQQHIKYSDLDSVFGDGYLVKHNFIYGKVRELTRLHGIKFKVCQTQDLIWPLLINLPNFKSTHSVKYVPNAALVERLIDIQDISLASFLKSPPMRNVLLHESVHIIVHSILENSFKPKLHSKKNKLFCLFIEESFALASSNLFNLYQNNDCMRYFGLVNDYISASTMEDLKKNQSQLRKLFGPLIRISFENTFFFLFICELYSLFDRSGLNKKEFDKICDLTSTPKGMRQDLRIYFNHYTKIQSDFKKLFIYPYLESQNLHNSLKNLLKSEPMTLLKTTGYVKGVKKFIQYFPEQNIG